MSFQFVHLESFSRKADSKGRSVSFVLAEARRDPAASVHVPHPSPPVVIFGVGVDEVERLHDAAADAARTTPTGGKPRRIQRTQHTLTTIVASHPYTIAEVRDDPVKRGEVVRWEALTLEWLKVQFGDKLVSVVRHEDEAHWHLHAYVLPDDPAMRASALHPGQCAKAVVMAAGPVDGEDAKALNKRGDQAYRQAMRLWQDSYHEAVAVPCGLTRLGPQRRRLTREQWQAEQVQAKALRATLDRAREVKRKGESLIASTKEEVAAIRAEAAAVKAEAARQLAAARAATEAAKVAQDKAVAEQRRARSMMARVREEGARVREAVARLQRLPGLFRGIWDGFRRSSLQDHIRQAVAGEIDELRRAACAAAERATAADAGRREAEARTRNLRENLADTGRELAEARQELAALQPESASPTPSSTFRRA